MIFGDRPRLDNNCILRWLFARANVWAMYMPPSRLCSAGVGESHGNDDVVELSYALANRDFRLNIFRRSDLQGTKYHVPTAL